MKRNLLKNMCSNRSAQVTKRRWSRSKILMTGLIILSALGSSLAVASSPVDINSADAQTLAQQLQGIGPVKARAIVAYRTTNGAFTDAAGILAVEGIGDSLFKRIQPYLLLSTNENVTQSVAVSGDTGLSSSSAIPLLEGN